MNCVERHTQWACASSRTMAGSELESRKTLAASRLKLYTEALEVLRSHAGKGATNDDKIDTAKDPQPKDGLKTNGTVLALLQQPLSPPRSPSVLRSAIKTKQDAGGPAGGLWSIVEGAVSKLSSEAGLAWEEKRLSDELAKVRLKREKLHKERLAITERREELLKCKTRMLERKNELAIDRKGLTETIDSCAQRRELAQSRLERLMRLHTINDAFHIWYSGPFATINGFRIGKLPEAQVGWPEINAGLGQAAIALSMVASALGIRFSRYILLPVGSFSKITRKEDGRLLYNFYSDESFSIFPRRNFNSALKAYVQCLGEAGVFVAQWDPTLQIPHPIDDNTGSVGGVSVALGSNLEDWTKAMKYMLTDLKWLLTWVAKYEGT